MRLWNSSHRGPTKAQASLRIRAVSPEHSPFAHMKYGSRPRVRPKKKKKSDIQLHLMVAHARLKIEFTDDKKYHNLIVRTCRKPDRSHLIKKKRAEKCHTLTILSPVH